MFKNVAAKFIMFAFDATTNVPKTGDAANITAYVSKDYGTVTVLGDTSATEMDATNAPGYYLFDTTSGETNADCLLVSGKSSTANIKVIGAPAVIYTRPNTGWLAPATAGRTLVVDASGLADANMVKAGPTGSGTAQTARDIGASVLLSSGTGTGQVKLASGYVAPNWGDVGNPTTTVGLSNTTVGTLTTYTGNTVQTGDAYARLGAPAGASIAADLVEIESETDGIAAISTATPLTAAQIATGVWQDATAGDFTAANSIGKSVMNGVSLGTGLTINAYTGNTAQTGDVVAVLTTTTYAEPSSVPAATSTLKDMIHYLFSKARNKSTQTATTFLLRNDGDSATIATSTVSDDGTTFIHGKDT